MKPALLLALGLCCTLPCRVRAQSSEAFGEPGQWLIDGSVNGSFSFQSWRQRPNPLLTSQSTEQWSFSVAPEALVFVLPNFAVGARVSIGIDRSEGADGIEVKGNSVGGSVLLAYHVGLGSHFFMLPELGLGVEYADRTVQSPLNDAFEITPEEVTDSSSSTLQRATLSLPFAWVLAPNFFAGLGPYVRVLYGSGATLREDKWSTAVGVTTMFGTWF